MRKVLQFFLWLKMQERMFVVGEIPLGMSKTKRIYVDRTNTTQKKNRQRKMTNNTSKLSQFDPRIHLAIELCHLYLTVHSGICGYMCLARAFGFRDWKDVVRHLIENKDQHTFSASTKRFIQKMEEDMEAHNWLCEGIDSSLYLNHSFRELNCCLMLIFPF